MAGWLLNRLLHSLLSLLGVVLVVFALFIYLPDPAQQTLGQRADVSTLENVRREFGLDKSKGEQLVLLLNDLSPIGLHSTDSAARAKYHYLPLFKTGPEKTLALKWPHLRRSYQNQRSVNEILAEALPRTAVLALFAFAVAFALGLFFGVVTAVRRGTPLASSLLIVAILGVSLPSFFAAILISWLFGYEWHWLTGLPMYGSLYEIDAYKGPTLALTNVILPALALGVRPLSIITQLTRSSMLETLSQEYVRTATAKGLSKSAVILKHALRNALNPVLTAASGWLASLLAGAFFIEHIFGWRGLGKVTVDALSVSDFPVVMGAVLLVALIFVVINLLVDVLYGVLDPRGR